MAQREPPAAGRSQTPQARQHGFDKHSRDIFLADMSYSIVQENFRDIRFFTSEFYNSHRNKSRSNSAFSEINSAGAFSTFHQYLQIPAPINSKHNITNVAILKYGVFIALF